MKNFESADTPQFLDVLRGTALQTCLDFWRRHRQASEVPLKASMDPVEMPRRILPNLFIYQQTEDGRFRCRLAGTEICRVFRHNPTGLYLDSLIVPSAVPSRQRLFSQVLEQAMPVVYTGRLMHTEQSFIRFCRLLLPVSATGAQADHIFGMVIFSESQRIGRGFHTLDDGVPEFEVWATAEDLADLPERHAACA